MVSLVALRGREWRWKSVYISSLKKKKIIEVSLIYNVVLVSGAVTKTKVIYDKRAVSSIFAKTLL